MTASTTWAAAFIAGGLLVASAPGAHAQLVGIDLSGTWVINAGLSDNPQEVFRKHIEEMRAQGRGPGGEGGERGGGGEGGEGGWGGGGGGHHHGGWGGEGGEGGQGGGSADAPHRQRMAPASRIVILEDDRKITMIPEGRDTITVYPDGQKRKIKTRLGEAEVKGEWKGQSLVLTTRMPNGHEITRTYSIDDNGRLQIADQIELRNGDTVQVVTRYDEAPPGTAAPKAPEPPKAPQPSKESKSSG